MDWRLERRSGGELGPSVNWCGGRVTLGHAHPLYKVHSVLALGVEEALWRARGDGDAEEVLQVTEVFHGELGVETHHDALQEGSRRSYKDDVVAVQEQVGGGVSLFEHKGGRVGDRGNEDEELEVGSDAGTRSEELVAGHTKSTAEDKHRQGKQGRQSQEAVGSTRSPPDDHGGRHSSRQAGGSAKSVKQQG